MSILIYVFTNIIYNEIQRIGTITTETFKLEKQKFVTFHAEKSMPLMTTMYFMFDTVIAKFNSNFDKNYSNDF